MAVANNPAFAKKVGIPRSVGEEFMKADKGKKFREGGIMKKKVRKFEEGGVAGRMMRDMAERYSERSTPLEELRSNIRSTGRAGMAAAKEAVGAMPQVRGAKELASRVKVPKSYEEEKGMKKGGMAESKMMVKKEVEFMKKKGAPKSMIKHEMAEAKGMKAGGYAKGGMSECKTIAKKEVKAHEKRMHKMAGGGKVAQLSKADGCATKGKSKGKMVKMAYGGKC